jgi:FKBP-type peptidyl-prolyl cis-trans isomerase FkpA
MKKYIYSALLFCAFSLTVNAQGNFQRTAKGNLYTIFTTNPGDKIKLNDVITFDFIQKTDKDSVLASSYTSGHPVKIQVQPSQVTGDLMDIFPLLTVNDSALVKVPTDSIFKGHEDRRPPFFAPGSFINFYVKIEKIQSLTDAIAERNGDLAKEKIAEAATADKYIAENKLVVKTTPSGLKYVITKLTQKRKPQVGDTVLVNYTGKLLSGQIFDSSIADVAKQAGLNQPGRTYEPIKIVLGQNQVIKGWEEGLLLVHEGGKIDLIIPSDLGYGDQPQGDAIPPFSTLAFNIELVAVKRIPHPVSPATKTPLHKKPATAAKKTS